jgi:eukaryotic-like serine/threonine-protein kinase
LADFNISSQPVGSEASGEEMFGGTFAYMSPEHLDAFNPGDETGQEAVTARSDLYSLGLLLQQLLEGRISFPLFTKKGNLIETLKKMASDRRASSPVCRKGLPGARMTLERTIGRCLEADPESRFASGAELAEQLDGCRRLRESERQLPPVRKMFGPILRHPFVWLVVLVVLPQLAASAVNIYYNLTQIVAVLNDAQKEKFYQTLFVYNLFAYPVGIPACVFGVWSIARCWKSLSNAERVSEADGKKARRRALRLPLLIAGLTAYGWFPGGIIFPFSIWMTTGLRITLACHFVASFFISGMIALAYSLCGVEFVVLRGLYPGLWLDARHFSAIARDELAPVQLHLTLIQWLAFLIPSVAALSLLLLGSESESNLTFRLLVAALIVLGMFGFIVTSAVTRRLSRVIVALTKPKG